MNKPKYIAIAAMTLDGKIAKNKNHPSDWTSKEDKLFMRALLDKCDVIIVGNNTYKTAIKPLSKRNCIVFSRSANKLVSKPSFAIQLRQGYVGQEASAGLRSAKLLFVNPTKVDVKKIINEQKYKTIAILGGGQTYTYCLENNMLDELYLTIEPIVFGQGIDLFYFKKFLNEKFKLVSVKKLNKQGSLLLRYQK